MNRSAADLLGSRTAFSHTSQRRPMCPDVLRRSRRRRDWRQGVFLGYGAWLTVSFFFR